MKIGDIVRVNAEGWFEYEVHNHPLPEQIKNQPQPIVEIADTHSGVRYMLAFPLVWFRPGHLEFVELAKERPILREKPATHYKILEVVGFLCDHGLETWLCPRSRIVQARHSVRRGLTEYSEVKFLQWVDIEKSDLDAHVIANETFTTLQGRIAKFIQEDEEKRKDPFNA